MKKTTIEEINSIPIARRARRKTPIRIQAEKLIVKFLQADCDIVVLDEDDWDGLVDYNDNKQLLWAYNTMRMAIFGKHIQESLPEGCSVNVTKRNDKLFLVREDV